MSLAMPERLYRLLPAFIRNRDLDEGEPLRALLAVIERELERVESGSAVLYDNWFIETCEEWVVPYIGDLLGVRPIRSIESAGVNARAYVANTIGYRRRKGTAVVLEQLARDVTGWPARAVEFFQRLATTQHTNHVRLAPAATPGIRDASKAELADGPFDPFSHTLEIRNASSGRGRFNIPNIGIYLWRLRSYAVGAGDPGDESPDFSSARFRGGWWTIHPAGCDSPLFNVPRTETTITHLAEEENVPGELRRLALNAELGRLRNGTALPAPVFMTAANPVFRLFVRLGGEALPVEVHREDIYICEIPDEVELSLPTPRAVALDPSRGRLSFPQALDVAEVWVQNSYGFSGDLAGGPYNRTASVRAANATFALDEAAASNVGFNDTGVWQAGVSHLSSITPGGPMYASLREAIEAWNLLPDGRTGVIVLTDSLTDDASVGGGIDIRIGERSRLLVVAGEWPLEPIPGAPPESVRRVPGRFSARGVRAHVIGDLSIRGDAAASSEDGGACFINGLLLEGNMAVAPGNLGQLSLTHSTVIPGRGSLHVSDSGNERLSVAVDHSICAATNVPGTIRALDIADSIVGDDSGSPDFSVDARETALNFLRSTFFGGVAGLTLSASDCIFGGFVEVTRRQTGCVRFSYVSPLSLVPRRYRCQPDLEIAARIESLRRSVAPAKPTPAQENAVADEAAALIRPLFVSLQYGDPDFGQLELRCDISIRAGAESGAEMGAFEFLRQPQREANLRDALAEYLRFAYEARLIYVT
jgi:hypothetical protein